MLCGKEDDRQEVDTMATHTKATTQRIYVKVNSDFDPTGAVTPRAIIWSDGRIFRIEAAQDFRPASTMGTGRSGDCFTVVIHGEEKLLFFERTDPHYGGRVGRWWIETIAE